MSSLIPRDSLFSRGSLFPRDPLFDFDSFANSFFGPLGFSRDVGETSFAPRVDIKENQDNYVITAELPGVKKEDLNVTLENGMLTISAETRQEDKEEKEGKVIRQERRYGKYMRGFSVGDNVKEEDIQASFKDGILTLTAKKSEPQAAEQARRIEITS